MQAKAKVPVEGLRARSMPLKGPAVQKPAANDAGDISWKVPMVKFYYPANIPNINFHHWAAGVALATSIAHKGAVAGSKVMAASIVECFKNPAVIEEAKRTFKEEIGGVEYQSMLPPRPEAAGRTQPRDDGEIPAADERALRQGEAGIRVRRSNSPGRLIACRSLPPARAPC